MRRWSGPKILLTTGRSRSRISRASAICRRHMRSDGVAHFECATFRESRFEVRAQSLAEGAAKPELVTLLRGGCKLHFRAQVP